MRAAHFLKFENDLYTVGVPNPYARDMLQHRMYRDIRRVLTSVVGAPVEMRFEVHKLPVEPEGELPLFKKLAEVSP
jgi:chromosomal replication initiation ATPase DnaA